MSGRMVLRTSLRDFEHLHRLCEGRRAGPQVGRQTMLNLLMDHALMVRRLKDEGVEVEDPEAGEPTPPMVRRRTRG